MCTSLVALPEGHYDLRKRLNSCPRCGPRFMGNGGQRLKFPSLGTISYFYSSSLLPVGSPQVRERVYVHCASIMLPVAEVAKAQKLTFSRAELHCILNSNGLARHV